MKIFPYGRNVVAVVSAVMDKDRQDVPRKCQAFARLGDSRREAKMARASTKPAAPGASMPPPAAPTQEQRPPSPPHAAKAAVGGAEVSTDICVDDYLVGGVAMFDAHTGQGRTGEFLNFFARSLRF
jgi:hypothetical protein